MRTSKPISQMPRSQELESLRSQAGRQLRSGRALTLEVPPPVDLTTIAVSPRVFGLPRARMPRGVHSSPVLLRGRFAR